MNSHGFNADQVLLGLGSPRRMVSDSRRVLPGDAFAAYPGERLDGRSFIGPAIDAGASAVVWEPRGFDWNTAWHVRNAAVYDLRQRLGLLAASTWGHPSRALFMVGVTGTNGKTSCTWWIAQALAALGEPSALLGTLGNGPVVAGVPRLDAAVNTTMDAAALQETLAGFRSRGVRNVAMEVSSHGIEQGRVNGVEFDIALFTNLTRDHLDYHGTLEAYGTAKARLLNWPELACAAINVDDAFGRRLAAERSGRGAPTLTYGFRGADVRADALRFGSEGVEIDVATPSGPGVLRAPVAGRFNAHNLLGVLCVLLGRGIPLSEALASLAAVSPPPGRMQRMGGGGKPTVIVDYAHTPDALENVLAAVRPMLAPGGRLVCLFGCGGDRDPGKRPLMGEVAARLADALVVTSDNPRSEDPDAIIAAILAGIPVERKPEVQPDRARAIADAVAGARPEDIVVLAGKGHEDYQEVNGSRRPFDDASHARSALALRGER